MSAYVRAKGARQTIVEAPQSVDNEWWGQRSDAMRRAAFQAAFVGRIAREKGSQVLIQAWRISGLSALSAALVLVGGGPIRARAVATGAVLSEGPRSPAGSTKLLSRKRRGGPAVGPHPRLPRAVGPGGQRSLQPGSPRDRHRCRRRRRRRARPARAHRPRGAGRRCAGARRGAPADAR